MDLEVLGAYKPFDWGDLGRMEKKHRKIRKKIRLCLVTVFVFYFQNLVFGNIKKK